MSQFLKGGYPEYRLDLVNGCTHRKETRTSSYTVTTALRAGARTSELVTDDSPPGHTHAKVADFRGFGLVKVAD